MPSCHIGVEMELEGSGNPLRTFESDSSLHNRLITAVHDGSLRNGIEMVFARPLFGENALAAIDHMYTVRDRLSIGGSARTSTHVHVNFSDTTDTLDTLRSTVATYLLIERAMSITAGPHREHNTFCVPTYVMPPGNERRYYDVAVGLMNDDRRTLDTLGQLGNENNRYAAMNLASLYRHGTVEFRQLGTVEKNQLIMWINTLLSIKKCGLANSVSQVLNGPDNLDDFVRTMLGEHASNCLILDDDGRNYFTAARERMRGLLRPASNQNSTIVVDDEPLDVSSIDVRTALQRYEEFMRVLSSTPSDILRSAITNQSPDGEDTSYLDRAYPSVDESAARRRWWNDCINPRIRQSLFGTLNFPWREAYAYMRPEQVLSIRNRIELLAGAMDEWYNATGPNEASRFTSVRANAEVLASAVRTLRQTNLPPDRFVTGITSSVPRGTTASWEPLYPTAEAMQRDNDPTPEF
jgi:hypothetical protein